MGEGGVKKSGKMSDIIYGWPLSCLLVAVASFGEPMLLVSAALRRLTECKANHYRCRRSFTCCFSFARVAVLFVSDDKPPPLPPLPLIRRHHAWFVLSGTSRNTVIVVELEVCKDDCQLVVRSKVTKTRYIYYQFY